MAPNPPGSVSVIQLDPTHPTISAVTTLDFSDASISFAALAAKGVRVNRDAPSAAADLEPEYITIQGNKAFITLQEANAVAIIEDITDPQPFTIDSIQTLGVQDHGRGAPSLATFDFEDLPLLGTDANGKEIDLGGFSGLTFKEETADTVSFYVIPDRGPNGSDLVAGARTFNLPEYQARILEVTLDKTTGVVSIGDEILLTRPDGAGGTLSITGLPKTSRAWARSRSTRPATRCPTTRSAPTWRASSSTMTAPSGRSTSTGRRSTTSRPTAR